MTKLLTEQELFELCKEVYKRFPEWCYTDDVWATNDLEFKPENYERISVNHEHFPLGFITQDFIPYYNSDYLLEKLPAFKTLSLQDGLFDCHLNVTPTGYRLDKLPKRIRWGAVYEDRNCDPIIVEVADTPLKALLKLVTALDDAGVKL